MMVQVAAPTAPGQSTNESSGSLTALAAAPIVAPSLPDFADAVGAPTVPATSSAETPASFDDAADILAPNTAPEFATSPAPPVAAGWAKYKFVTLVGAGALGGSLIVAAVLSLTKEN